MYNNQRLYNFRYPNLRLWQSKMNNIYTPRFLSHLRHGIMESYNMEEFKNLCSDLGVDHENLGGEGKDAKIRELIAYLNRRGNLSGLIEKCLAERPQYPWKLDETDSMLDNPNLIVDADQKINILFLAS